MISKTEDWRCDSFKREHYRKCIFWQTWTMSQNAVIMHETYLEQDQLTLQVNRMREEDYLTLQPDSSCLPVKWRDTVAHTKHVQWQILKQQTMSCNILITVSMALSEHSNDPAHNCNCSVADALQLSAWSWECSDSARCHALRCSR